MNVVNRVDREEKAKESVRRTEKIQTDREREREKQRVRERESAREANKREREIE